MTDTHTAARIPDEAVWAFIERYEIGCNHRYDENSIRAALTAALPYLSAPCAVEVKPSSLVNGANILASDMPHIVVQKLDAAYSQLVTKPVDVASVRRQAFEEGFENGVEQSLNALDAYDDITRNEAEQGIRKLKPDYRALSSEPAQGEQCNHITDASEMVDALKETRIDLVVLQGNVADAAKTNSNWEEMPARIREWIDRIDAALPAAPTTEAGK